MDETTGTDKAPSEAPITPPPDEVGHEDVSGGETTPPSGAPEVAEKQGDHWELKDEPGPSDPPSETAEGVDANKPKDDLLEDARRADIAGRSDMTKDELVEALQKHNRRETARARG